MCEPPSRDRSTTRGIALLAISLSIAGGAAIARCEPLEGRSCTVWLNGENAPRVSPRCEDGVWKKHLRFSLPERFADSNDDGWVETVLRVDLPPAFECGCAVFRVHYSEQTSGFSTHIGNSPTNDGGGGDAGKTKLAYAEAHTSREQLLVYTTGRLDRPGRTGEPGREGIQHDTALNIGLPDLAGRVLEIEVCNQYLRLETDGPEGAPVQAQLQSLLHRQLFVIDDRQHTIHAGFNRAIYRPAGAPSGDRFGSGVERVEIFLGP